MLEKHTDRQFLQWVALNTWCVQSAYFLFIIPLIINPLNVYIMECFDCIDYSFCALCIGYQPVKCVFYTLDYPRNKYMTVISEYFKNDNIISVGSIINQSAVSKVSIIDV